MDRTFELYSEAFSQDPHAVFDAMRAQAPIVRELAFDGKTEAWFVVGYDEATAVLRNEDLFIRDFRKLHGDNAFGEGVFNMISAHMLNRDGEDHRRLRSHLSRAFTPRFVNGLRPQIEATAHALIDKMEAAGSVDLMEAYALPLPIAMLCDLMGVPESDYAFVREFTDVIFLPEDQIDGGIEHVQAVSMQFFVYMQQLVEDRRQNPGSDIISALVSAEADGDKLNEHELFSTIGLLIMAGFETTYGLIGNGVAALLQHPDLMAQLRANPAQTSSFVDELVRYDGAVERALVRLVARDETFAGIDFKQDDWVVVVLGAANHDPDQFACPHMLDITRDNNKHLGFGHGPHYCLGAPLARAESEIAFNTLLQRLPTLTLDIDPNALTWVHSPGFRRLKTLPVRW